jgi:tRNA pseudouridine55 synthase
MDIDMRAVPEEAIHGLVIIDKPLGMTSRKALNILKRQLPRRTKIGHTGTLDPLATGVLVVCLGWATRLAEYVQDMPKTYRAGVLLGARSDTNDKEGTLTPTQVERAPDLNEVAGALTRFIGETAQTPPAFSAAKVAGQRAYQLARRGQAFELAARRIQIHGIELLSYNYPHLDLAIQCGKGTYIRSLARDLGESIGCGGLIESLRRTAVGPFLCEAGIPPDADIAVLRERLLPAIAALSLVPRITLPDELAKDLEHGRIVDLIGNQVHLADGPLAAVKADGTLIAVVRASVDKSQLKAEKVLPTPGCRLWIGVGRAD